jgi:sulfoacetaldehyde dehydrogenase
MTVAIRGPAATTHKEPTMSGAAARPLEPGQDASQDASQDAHHVVAGLMARARAAQGAFADATQERADEAVRALAWSLYKPEHAKELAELAVEDTGLGNVPDKITKKQRKTFGTLRDLLRAKSVGEIERDEKRGLVKFAKPLGVVGAVTPSTNPGATPVNKAMMALKGRNAIIVAPSPLGLRTTQRCVDLMRAELERVGLPADLVQILPAPITKELTQALMSAVDLVVVTGSQDNVKRAYSSGTPAIGVGAGNVPVIIDETADLDAAARRICASKTFDNATSCSSENSVVIVDAVYDAAIAALERAGGYLVPPEAKSRIVGELWKNGKLNRHLIAKDAARLAEAFGLPEEARRSKFVMIEETGVGRDHPLSGEKLALVLTVYRASDFAAAKERVREILNFQGLGHSLGLHTTDMTRAHELAADMPVVRVLVNFAHTFGNGGGFDSGLEFTLTMGCGSWQKNSISENLNYRHFLNITHLVTPIPEDKPSEEELFGPHWSRYGK